MSGTARVCVRCQTVRYGDSPPEAEGDKAELVAALNRIRETMGNDPEAAHGAADKALLDYIGDEEVEEAFKSILMRYA